MWHFGAEACSPEQADDHQGKIERTFDKLMRNPELGRKRDDLIPELRSMVVAPHLIFCRISALSIQIVRVLHARFDTKVHFRHTKPEKGHD
ncbi:type II toxin-antitoxin system RelE/ParE family toxin [Bradyrhizobium genosp. A]|uniref:type II toxin-antitoxin system RelE/ParE family toxin n=1 Tax=Bradyrhizobium genosp. A TaxID=83626 RepID=UPI003CF3EF96